MEQFSVLAVTFSDFSEPADFPFYRAIIALF